MNKPMSREKRNTLKTWVKGIKRASKELSDKIDNEIIEDFIRDSFRPKTEPARTIYDAFQEEAKFRKVETDFSEDWIYRERMAVYEASVKYAKEHNLNIPEIEDVERAESYALGSTDYGAKWAYKLADFMTKKNW